MEESKTKIVLDWTVHDVSDIGINSDSDQTKNNSSEGENEYKESYIS